MTLPLAGLAPVMLQTLDINYPSKKSDEHGARLLAGQEGKGCSLFLPAQVQRDGWLLQRRQRVKRSIDFVDRMIMCEAQAKHSARVGET
jgi:hypothetical protein